MEYSQDYLIHYYEIDSKRRLTLPTLMHYFEDIAILNSEAQGYTLDYYDRTHHGFMLIKWNINIYQLPVFNETITIITQPYSFKRFLANRRYRVVNKEGEVLAEAKTVWLFADTLTRKPDKIPEDLYLGFDIPKENEKLFEILDDPQKLTVGTYHLKIKTTSPDLDSNNHVNNVRYVVWALESLPKEFISLHKVAGTLISYVKELNLDDEAELISEIKYDGEKIFSRHSFYSCDKDICHIQIEWNKE